MDKSNKIVVRTVFALITVISLMGCRVSVTGPGDGGGPGIPDELPTAQT
jgi:hypothetical protein